MDWDEQIASALDAAYGEQGVGMANHDPNAVAQYIHVLAARDHIVYVTSGGYRHTSPHEFVLRVRFIDPPRDERLWQVAPQWPVHVLAEIARCELTSPRPFVPRNHLSNMQLPGAPFRHFSFVGDPVLRPIYAGGGVLAFVQAIPLTDEQHAAIEAIPTGATNIVLRDWAARDPLFLVG